MQYSNKDLLLALALNNFFSIKNKFTKLSEANAELDRYKKKISELLKLLKIKDDKDIDRVKQMSDPYIINYDELNKLTSSDISKLKNYENKLHDNKLVTGIVGLQQKVIDRDNEINGLRNNIAILEQKLRDKKAASSTIRGQIKDLIKLGEIYKEKLQENGISLEMDYSLDKCRKLLQDNGINAFDINAWVNENANKALDYHYKIEHCAKYYGDLINEKDFREIFDKLGLNMDDPNAIKNWLDDQQTWLM